jgi:two-component system sensor histidine kinase YesM
MAMVSKCSNVADMVASLGHLLEASVGRKGDTVTVGEEVEYLQEYSKLQQTRYGNKYHMEFEVEDCIRTKTVLRLTLQPIVENAIIHGVAVKEGGGRIIVRGRRCGSDIVFEVEDDGVGMDEETLRRLEDTHQGSTKGLTHMGVASTAERLKIHYGHSYGLSIESHRGKGTLVTIRIPSIERLEEKSDDDV